MIDLELRYVAASTNAKMHFDESSSTVKPSAVRHTTSSQIYILSIILYRAQMWQNMAEMWLNFPKFVRCLEARRS
eukprot:COSAG01_NODE_38557_length_488_cov_0.832905_1_plen_75_part_00